MKYTLQGKLLGMLLAAGVVVMLSRCNNKEEANPPWRNNPVLEKYFGDNIRNDRWDAYDQMDIPSYIQADNAPGFSLDNLKASIGRILFYDKNLSVDGTVSCASCHKQEFAFGDTADVSQGMVGTPAKRHSMRLLNLRYGREKRMFWDRRAKDVEMQVTMPIRDHFELGFSGQGGRPSFKELPARLAKLPYYPLLMFKAYGDSMVDTTRIRDCLVHFVRSIVSYDSRFDRALTANGNQMNGKFSMFTEQENKGKDLFVSSQVINGNGHRVGGGLGCGSCHTAPEFDIDPSMGNNGIIDTYNSPDKELNIFRAPTLRDFIHPLGRLNGPLMHNASLRTLEALVNHYNEIPFDMQNPGIDPRLFHNGAGNHLHLTENERQALMAFLKTLSGQSIYTDRRWSDPFIP